MDELTLKVILTELAPVLEGAVIRGAFRVSPLAVALELADEAGRQSVLTVAPYDGGAMFYLEGRRDERRGRIKTPLDGATLLAAGQWHDDRVAFVDVASPDGARRLVAEFFGRAGGLFVLEGDIVSARLAGRPVETGEPYVWPAVRERKNPEDITPEEMASLVEAGGERALVRDIAYMSPWAARAIVAGGGDRDAAARRLAAFAEVAAGGPAAPLAVLINGGWRPFPCDIFDGAAADDVKRFDTANEAAAFAWAENQRLGEVEAVRRRATRGLSAAVKRLERQRHALERRREEYGQYEEYRRMGEALKYNLGAVRKGMKVVTLPDPYGDGEVDVELKAELSPAENMERLFTLYRKARRGVEAVAARLAALEGELSRARKDLAAAMAAGGVEELEPWLGEGSAGGREPGSAGERGPGRRYVSSDGLVIIVGRSAAENDEITFKFARPHDLWLHAQQARGSHVVIRRGDKNKPVPRRTVEEAASLAAFFSGDKHAGVVPVTVVERRHVRRAKGAPGRVTYRGGDVVFVEPAEIIKPAAKGEP
jgi:predicted ribosome quality control (RQC) complex YloA/Tae2 family protein